MLRPLPAVRGRSFQAATLLPGALLTVTSTPPTNATVAAAAGPSSAPFSLSTTANITAAQAAEAAAAAAVPSEGGASVLITGYASSAHLLRSNILVCQALLDVVDAVLLVGWPEKICRG